MQALIPQPTHVQWGNGAFVLTARSSIGGDPAAAAAVRRVLAGTTGLPLPLADQPEITVEVSSELPEEGYRLTVSPSTVHIVAGSARGAGWAAQTMLQLAPAEVFTAPLGVPVELAAAHIEDAPRFARRGAMLDSARHFVPLHDVYHFIDWLARHKLNVFHWHLTDDQGWRIASDKYPLLAQVASWRTKTSNRVWGDDATPHGGYYTLAQIKAVADYARALGIETVPEIDFPGHATALLAAYPEFATDPSQLEGVAHYPTIFNNVLNFSDEAMDFVHHIWDEVIKATGAKYVHIGGDEVPTKHWEASEEVKARAAAFGVTDVTKIQRWFTLHMRDWLAERGVTPIGWDEVVDDGAIEAMVCQEWRSADKGGAAIAAGMQVVRSPQTHTYFDFYQSDLRTEPYGMGTVVPVELVYSFDPCAGLTAEQSKLVLGTQFQLWSEFLPTYRAVQYAAWPRGCALAEVAWSDPAGRDFAEFEPRLAQHLDRLAAAGINYRPLSGILPWQEGGEGWRKRPPGDV